MARRFFVILAVLFLGIAGIPAQGAAEAYGNADTKGNTMVSMRFAEEEILIELYDNPTAGDLLGMLPLTLTFEDYASTEKITYLPRKLSLEEAPEGYEPSSGDFALYAPWGNVALFYRDFSYSRGIVPLGRVVSGLEKLHTLSSPFTAELTVKD